MRPLDSGIVSVDTYLITQKLLILVPDNRVFVHGHTRILRIIHQGIANALDIEPVSAHLMKGMHFTVHGVGIDMKCIYLKGIGMNIQGIFLRIIYRNSFFSGHTVSFGFIIIAVIALKLIFIFLVGIDDIVESLTDFSL